jgi:hypothetical protein
MTEFAPNARRGFLARLAGATAVFTAGVGLDRPLAAEPAQASPHDAWLNKMTGMHRCFFDAPLHGDGLPLIHILNYINSYKSSYGVPASRVNTVTTCYGAPGKPSTMPLAWNDAMWEKYKVGELLNLTDPSTKAPTRRNMFYRPRSGDPVFFGGAMAAAGMENLQSQGTLFLMCNNAFMAWVGFLSNNGQRNAAEIEREIRANLLPGVITVPAMVIAIEKAQGKGIAYNRQ